MLVILLMGMMSVGVVMTLPNRLISEDNIAWQAQRFSTLLQFAEDEALISGLELGIVFTETSYQFAFYDNKAKKWLPVVNEQIQGKIEMPELIAMESVLTGSVWDEIDTEEQDEFIDEDDLVSIDGEQKIVSLKPQVYVMSSGEVTPSSLLFSVDQKSEKQQPILLTVSMSGAITFPESQQ